MDDGQIVSGSENDSRMNESGPGMTGQFGGGGGEGIRDNFHNTSAKNSRNAKYNGRHDISDSPTNGSDMLSPFGAAGSSNKPGLKERFAAAGNGKGGSNLNVPDNFASGGKAGSASSSHRTQAMVDKYGGSGIQVNKYRKEGSSLNMRREDSDMSLTNGKFESVEQRAIENPQMSPPDRKRKTNILLEPMNHL